METKAIITKVQFNLTSDNRLYSLLSNVNKRKRAYIVKKMLNEFLQIQDVLATYNNSYNSKDLEHCDFNKTDTDKNIDSTPFSESIEYLLEDFSSPYR